MTVSYTCPKCNRTSYHPMDVKFQWCGSCKESPLGIKDAERHGMGSLAAFAPDVDPATLIEAARRLKLDEGGSPWGRRPVLWEGSIIGYVEWSGQNDWEDLRGEDGHCARTALYEILEDFPRCPTSPEMKPQPWFFLVLREICKVFTGERNEKFEKQVTHRYLRHYGIAQMEKLFLGRGE